MILLVWWGLHLVAMLVMGQLTPRRKFFYLSLSECLIVALWYFVPFSALLTPSDLSPAQFTVGFLMYASGASLLTWARRVNPHFRAQIVRPPEVIQSGPYRWLNHPGYHGMAAMGLGSALMVRAHVIGYLALGIYCFVLMLRAQEENRLLASTERAASTHN